MLVFRKDKHSGYMYAIDSSHPLANKSGKIYEHIYVMCNHIGRKLNPDECVHHIDRNKENNSLSNLQLMTIQSMLNCMLKKIEVLNLKRLNA